MVVVGQAITDPISGPSLSFVFCLLALSLTIKPYNCDKCGNGYVNKDNWKNHKCAGRKIMKPFNCNKCGKGYSDKKYLKAHNCGTKRSLILEGSH